jgi:hypothetical protein
MYKNDDIMLLQTRAAVETDAPSPTDKRHAQGLTLVSWTEAIEQDPNLFKGCRNIFLDVGSNRGTHVRKLFEAHKYPGSPYLRLFEDGFGPAEMRNQSFNKTGICAFGFEANPRWAQRLLQIETAYKAMGWRVKWFSPTAVGNKTGSMTLYLNDNGTKSDWSFSKVNYFKQSVAHSVKVDELDFADFVERLHGSALPGYRLMKMDIESAEYEVLPPFLTKQLLCKNVLDDISIEWHHNFFNDTAKVQKCRSLEEQVHSMTKCHAGPSTNVMQFDDESYLGDGMPLP